MRKYGDDTHYSDSEKYMNGIVQPSRRYVPRTRPTYEPKSTNNVVSSHEHESSKYLSHRKKSSKYSSTKRKTSHKPITNKKKISYKNTYYNSKSRYKPKSKNYVNPKKCTYCGHVYDDINYKKFCPRCGRPIGTTNKNYSKSTSTGNDDWENFIIVILVFVLFAFIFFIMFGDIIFR